MTIPTALESQQRLAADPARSAWVTANAGSGKTHVLVQRVLRLLLDGVDPARLLCLTFTNAAAAQMADRISLSLGHWAVADDEKLAGILHDILGRPAKQHEQARARRLFAQAIETPGRLKIQTIHAFCERVLQLFPFEAGVPAGFDVLDDLEARRLTDAALGEILTEAEADRDSEAAALLDDILARSGEHAMRDALAKLISRRGRYLAWRRNGGTAHRYLGIDRRLTADDIVRSFAASSRVMASGWGDVCEALLGDAGTAMQKLGSTFQQAAGDTLAQARCVIAAYFTQQNLPLANFPAKSLQKSAPALYAAFDADRGAAIAAKDRVLAVELAASSEALFGFADKVLAAYARLKAEASALDFDDLIGRMEALLANGHGPWVLYRLDRGIDHILVDEAQDTSPEQWRIVRALAEEFFAGEGASGKVRTIFAVGDEKQSIYSFQGADPQGFREMKSLFRRRVDQAGLAFSAVALTHSFRSTPEILASVDAVFALDDAARGVAERDANGSALGLGHVAIHDAQAGVVELWPPVPARQKDEKEAWDAPLDRDDETHNTVILAKAIAGKIKALIDAGTILPSTGRNGSSRAAGEGDFLILLRKRTRLARPIVKALKDAGLRVAGADRLRIAEHIAVEDLIGLGTLCWLPDDDLTLAAVLKSPLFGLGEDDIYRLAVDRTGSLHDALAASPDERHRDAYRRLDAFRAKGRAARPFDFYADVLGAGGGRDAIHARMGMEALDPVDEFLSLALSYEQAHAATLPGFVAWIAEGGAEIKRDMDEDGGEVRVMTVHGSKGLEAPIVFLPDTMSVPTSKDLDAVLFDAGADPFEPALGALWMPPDKECPDIARRLRRKALDAAEEEYRRLLYVAMTRAKDRLYICGAAAQKAPSGTPWHALAEAGIRPLAREVEDVAGTILRIGEEAEMPGHPPPRQAGETPLPGWATAAAPSETPITRARPSAIFRRADEGAVRRGLLVHGLLEILPDVPAARRMEAAGRYLDVHAGDLAADTRMTIARNVLAILDAPAFAAVFAEGSAAEVAIAGTLAEGAESRFVSGRIDRLIVGEEEVLIVDFKSDTAPPPPGAPLPPHYAGQMRDYLRLTRAAYPNRRVRVAILWTALPRLDPVDAIEEPALA